MTYLSVMRYPDPGAAHELEVTDKFAADDTRAGATDFGDITEFQGPHFPLGTVDGDADGIEYYRFTLTEAKQVGLGLRRQDANADLFLEDADGTVLYSSTNSGTPTRRSRRRCSRGPIYVRVQSQEAGENAHVVRYGVSAPDADDLAALQQQSDTATNAAPAFGQQGYESGTTRFTQTVRASDGSETVDTTVTVNVTDVEETADPPAAEEDEASSTLDTVSEPGDGDFSAATSTSGRVVVGETATGLRVRQTTTTAPAQPSLLPTGSILRASPPPRPACAFLREIGTSAPLSIY